MMALTATVLRRDIYKILDTVLATGLPVDIVRNGKHLKLIAVDAPSKLSLLKPMKGLIKGDPAELEKVDWSETWKNDLS